MHLQWYIPLTRIHERIEYLAGSYQIRLTNLSVAAAVFLVNFLARPYCLVGGVQVRRGIRLLKKGREKRRMVKS